MAKKDKKTGRVIEISDEDRLLFKKYLIMLEELGIYKTPIQISSDLFSIGLHSEYEIILRTNDDTIN